MNESEAQSMAPEATLNFANTADEIKTMEGKEELLKEVGELVKQFHLSIEKCSEKYNLKLDSTVVFKIVE